MSEVSTNLLISTRAKTATLCVTLLWLTSIVPGLGSVAFAHEGHGTEEVGEFDPDAPRKVSPQTAKHMGLKTAEVDIRPIEDVVALSGIVKVQPDRQYSVLSLIDGQVVRAHVRVGDRVTAGQILVELQSLPYLERWSKLQILQAQIEALEFNQRAAAEQLKRTESLAGQSVPERELALRRAELAQVESSIKLVQIEAQQVEVWLRAITPTLDLTQAPHDRLALRATADGIVVQRWVKPKQWVTAGQPLFEVADYSVVQVEGQLPESLIAQIRGRSSDKVRVRTPSDPSFLGEGTVRYIAPELDPVTRTAQLIIDVPNPEGVLRSEMWVDLAIVLREVKEALVIPRQGVVVQGPMHFVFVQNGDHYEKQDIVPGVQDDQYVEVIDGLLPGDVVVVEGAYSLTHLRPKGRAMASAAPTATEYGSGQDNSVTPTPNE